MAMSPAGMADEIFKAMEAVYGDMTEGKAETMKYLTTFSTGIIKHLIENTDVIPGTLVVSGVPVTGTGKVT
ncbi:MAG: hypothetical protein FWH12_06485 [Treponema sp.]|nr:hypothetical protein [Treponema sp.]